MLLYRNLGVVVDWLVLWTIDQVVQLSLCLSPPKYMYKLVLLYLML